MFEFVEERTETAALSLRYHLAPWDYAFFAANTAVLSSIHLRDEREAAPDFEAFRRWCRRNDVRLVCCRLPQGRLTESAFLESQGFRFIELNYRPIIGRLGRFVADKAMRVVRADPSDAAIMADIVRRTFKTGRLHVDPQVDPEIGSQRYAGWMLNAFRNPAQRVLKCMMDGRLVWFSVVEQPTPTTCLWSLVGLGTDLPDKGLGPGLAPRAFHTMLAFHHGEGCRQVASSISSHNGAIFSLHARTGWHFPAPSMTLHWCPFGPVKAQAA